LDFDSLKAHVPAFFAAYKFAKHLKALKWKTPFQAICDACTKEPAPFKLDSRHVIPGPHIQLSWACASASGCLLSGVSFRQPWR